MIMKKVVRFLLFLCLGTFFLSASAQSTLSELLGREDVMELLRMYSSSQDYGSYPMTYGRMRSSTHDIATERARIPDLSTRSNPKYYYIKNAATGEYLSYDGANADLRMIKVPNDSAKFFFEVSESWTRGEAGRMYSPLAKGNSTSSSLSDCVPYWGPGTRLWSGPYWSGSILNSTAQYHTPPSWTFFQTEDRRGCYISYNSGSETVWRYDQEQKKVVQGERDEYAVWIVEAVPSLPSTYTWYVVKNVKTGKYLHYEGASSAMSLVKSPDPCSLFSASSQGNGVVIRNHASGNLYFAGENVWSSYGQALKFVNSSENNYHFYISASGNKNGSDIWYHDEETNTLKTGFYGDNSLWEFEKITNFKEIFGYCSNGEGWNELDLEAEKLLQSKEQLSFFELYTYTLAILAVSWNMDEAEVTYDQARNAVVELKTTINTIEAQYGSSEDLIIRNIGHDGAIRNLATNSSSLIFNDADYLHTNAWKMFVDGDLLNGEGDIRMMLYNTVTKKYVAAPQDDENGLVTIGMTANKDEAGSWMLMDMSMSEGNGGYSFKIEASLESESLPGCFLQLANPDDELVSCVMVDKETGNYPQGLKWEFLMGNAVIDDKVYDYVSDLAIRYPQQWQETIGCVKPGYYTCNYPSSVSTDNLLDYKVETCFWTEDADNGEAKPYLQADLGAGKALSEFYFYMRPNLESWQGVPVKIIVEGSNSANGSFVKLAEVEASSLLYDMCYCSSLVKAGTSYRYLRFTMDEVTGESVRDFVLSEFYILPNTPEVAETSGLIKDFYSDAYMGAEILHPAVALIKKEAEYYLELYKDKHAVSPIVGQCSTFKYNALLDAYNAVDANNVESVVNLVIALEELFSTDLEFICILKSAWEDGYSKDDAVAVNLSGGNVRIQEYNTWDLRQWCIITNKSAETDKPFSLEFVPIEGAQFFINLEQVAGWDKLYASHKMAYSVDGDYAGTSGYLSVVESAGNKYIDASDMPATTTQNKNAAWYLSIISSKVDVPRVNDRVFIEALAEFGKTFTQAKDYYEGAKVGRYIYQSTNGLSKADFDDIYEELLPYYNMGIVALIDMFVDGVLTHEMLAGLDEILPLLRAHFPNFLTSREVIAGYYFRLCGKDSEVFLTDDPEKGFVVSSIQNNQSAEEQSIFYTVPNGDEVSMMSFSSGRYVTGANSAISYGAIPVDGYSHTMQTAGLGYSMSENAYYNTIVFGGVNYLNRTGQQAGVSTKPVNDGAYDWEVKIVEELPIRISSVLYATLYVPVELIIPNGVTAYVLYDEVTNSGGERVLRLKELKGGVLPAGLPVVLKAESAGVYYFPINYESTLSSDADKQATYCYDGDIENLLDGRHSSTYIPEKSGYIHYILAKGSKGVGMYKVKMDDANVGGVNCFQNNAHRAWLPNPKSITTGAAGYRFSVAGRDESTSIDGIVDDATETEIYDLQGRRVPYMTKGVYIVNGKKVVK